MHTARTIERSYTRRPEHRAISSQCRGALDIFRAAQTAASSTSDILRLVAAWVIQLPELDDEESTLAAL